MNVYVYIIYMHIHGQTFKANGPWLINEEIWKVMVGWYFESWPDDLRNVGSQITNDGKGTTNITVTGIIIVINIVVTNIHLIPTNNYHHIHPHNTKLEVNYYDGRQNYHNHHCHNKYYHHHHHNHHDHHDQLAPWPDDL